MKDRGVITGDFNNYRLPGIYRYNGEPSILNAPGSVAGNLEIIVTTGYVIQRITAYDRTYTRRYNGTVWTDWADHVTKSDFAVVRVDVAVASANTRTEITQMSARGRYWIPVVDGHSSAIVSRPEVTYDGSKWYIFADIAQTYYVSFYKYPVTL